MSKLPKITAERRGLARPKIVNASRLSGPSTPKFLAKKGKGDAKSEPAPKKGLLLPGVEIIGRGMDVLHGNFATSTSTLDQLFDIKDRIGPEDTEHPTRANAYASCERLYGVDTYGLVEVEPVIGGENVMSSWSGNRITTVQTMASADAQIEGKHGMFEGDMKVMGSKKSAKSASTFFCQKNGRFPKYILRLNPFKPLWDLLLPDVRNALASATSDALKADFFPKYGGYYLHNAVIGGCLKYTAVRRTSSSETDSKFEASMTASYNYGIGKVKGSARVAAEKKDSDFRASSESALTYRGGTSLPDYGTEGAVNEWVKTILDAPELIDFENAKGAGCRPVWGLIADPARAEVVKLAFQEYVEEHKGDFDFFDPDLVPLYGYKDWKTHDLRRWFYSRNANHPRGKEWGNRHHDHIKIYPSARPGCSQFFSVRKKVTWGIWPGKKSVHIYKIVKGKVPSGWKETSAFFAPTKPLSGTLDKWSPIYEYTRGDHADRCGKHYNTKGAKVGNWKRSKDPVFYAVV